MDGQINMYVLVIRHKHICARGPQGENISSNIQTGYWVWGG